MKRKLGILLLMILLLGGISSCSNTDTGSEATSTQTELNPTNPLETMPDISESTELIPGETKPLNPTPSEDKPVAPARKTLSEAKKLCNTIAPSYKESFNTELMVSLKGQVISDFAISGNYHFMILADESGLLPICVNANKQSLDKYIVGNSYIVSGSCGSYRNQPCVRVLENPIREKDGVANAEAFAKAGTIDMVYDKAYALEARENNSNIDINVLKVRATFVARITDTLSMIYNDGKHIILHSEKKYNATLNPGYIYDFHIMPSVAMGKRAGELISSKAVGTKNPNYLEEIKASAISASIDTLSQIDRYNDNRELYPHIFKVSCYVGANVIGTDHHLAFIDSIDTNIKYDKNNERPKAIYCKNHVVDDFNSKYSNLVPYYNNNIKGEFYFIATDYQSSYHCFQGFVIDELTRVIEEK